ncbi:Salt Induced Serine rich [Hibiscus trionum]|uniref:Salt Induced Serine rich n=1 Tax=Hibiscus trionum TaxID=183268 RepID=A0A9W7GUI4_HIBTR|nr:Salt Induced Serine rich [Hibiscus trionum]
MEGSKGVGSSSFTSELFGSKDLPSSSSGNGILSSIFGPPSKVLGRESLHPDSNTNRQNEPWNTKPGPAGENPNTYRSSYQEQRVQPCNLSSSIYYGGQDIYPLPQSSQGYASNSMYKKNGGEEDSGMASRGNWWLGSLYY